MTPEEELKAQIDARLAEREAPPASDETQAPNPVAVELVRLRKRTDQHIKAVMALNAERLARKHAHEQLMDEEAAEILRRRSARRGHIISGIVGFFAGSILAGLGYAQQQRSRASQTDDERPR